MFATTLAAWSPPWCEGRGVGDRTTVRRMLVEAWSVLDRVGSHEQTSGYAVSRRRLSVFITLLSAQDAAEARFPRGPAPVCHSTPSMHQGRW